MFINILSLVSRNEGQYWNWKRISAQPIHKKLRSIECKALVEAKILLHIQSGLPADFWGARTVGAHEREALALWVAQN